MSVAKWKTKWIVAGLLALSSLLYIGTAASPALVDDDIDAAHALVAREMLERHDFVVMYMDGIRYLIRPPMHFWMVAASYAVLGESAFATRLPVALAMIAMVLLAFEFGRRFFDVRAGIYGALITATSVGMFIFTRTMIPDAICALEFLALFYVFLRAWTRSLDPRIGYWGAAAVCALAVLTRGVIGLLFPGAVILGFITLTRGWSRWRELHLVSSFAIFLAVAAPWHILASLRAPGFYWAYFINEHINRALGTRLPHDYSAVPLWLWWVEHFIWLFPWSFFVPLIFSKFPAMRAWSDDRDKATQVRLLLFLWAAVILLFFSIESGSRMEYYSFGAWPALALLLGLAIADGEEANRRWLRVSSRVLATVGLLFAAAAGVILRTFASGAGIFSADVKTHGTDFYQSSMTHVLDITPQALADLRVPIMISAGSMLFAFLTAWILRERRRHFSSTAVVALGMVGFFFAANLANKAFEPTLSSIALAVEINKNIGPRDQIALYGDIRVAPGVAFYSHRRALLFNASGSNLEYGSHFPDAPKIFFADQDFLPIWTGAGRVYLVVQEEKNAEALAKLPPYSAWILASAGGKTVYVNQPPNTGATTPKRSDSVRTEPLAPQDFPAR